MYITINAVYAFTSRDGETPLLCAAASGQDDVVAYLLKFSAVLAELKQLTKVNASVSSVQGVYIYICILSAYIVGISHLE